MPLAASGLRLRATGCRGIVGIFFNNKPVHLPRNSLDTVQALIVPTHRGSEPQGTVTLCDASMGGQATGRHYGVSVLSGGFSIIFASFSRANREGLNLPATQLFTVCRGKPMSSKAWRVFLDMYSFMDGILPLMFSRCQSFLLTTFSTRGTRISNIRSRPPWGEAADVGIGPPTDPRERANGGTSQGARIHERSRRPLRTYEAR